MKRIIYIILLLKIMTSCIGAGTHGKIKSYYFNCSTEELISKVDQFLLGNPNYFDTITEDNGWIFIKLPPQNNKYGFRIGGNSEITLISMGKENEVTSWKTEFSPSEKVSFIDIFQKEFIQKLDSITPKTEEYLKNPFILTINENPIHNRWGHYVVKYDTLLSYPLPNEFDSLGIDYFEDLIISYANYTEENISVNQYYNLFRINKEVSGYIKDSIYITSLYRVIGQNLNSNIIFNKKEWINYTSMIKEKERILEYINLRQIKTEKNYNPTDIYSDMSQEYWMINRKELIKTVGKTTKYSDCR